MKYFRCFLVLILVLANTAPVLASDDPDKIVSDDMASFRKWWEDHLDDFQKCGKPSIGATNRALARSYGDSYKTYKGYDQVASTPEGKAALMSQLSTLATFMAQTAGTSAASSNAAKLAVVASNLSTSKDGDLRQASKILSDEASAMKSGNTSGADNCASSMSSLAASVASTSGGSGNSSGSNSQATSALKAVMAGLISTCTGGVGSIFVAGVLSLLGVSQNGSISGISQSGVRSLTSGGSADSAGAGAINSAGSAINHDLNTVSTDARTSISSSGTSGAPSSK